MEKMHTEFSQAIEDYLKVIYELTAQSERATTNQIAEAMKVTPASASEMVKRLAETKPPLVDYQKHHGVVLTPAGERVALEILRHHRLLEMFLYQILGYHWDEVHDEADRLEHVISEEFEERIAQALGNPIRDPHGDPIPSRDLYLPVEQATLLAELQPGAQAQVSRVRSMDTQLLRYLSEHGLVPQARLTVLDVSPFDDNLVLLVEGAETPLVLGPKVTRKIFVALD
jgi:DtxR family transcriptional regulator, Mn-dependent transcriptional regulator